MIRVVRGRVELEAVDRGRPSCSSAEFVVNKLMFAAIVVCLLVLVGTGCSNKPVRGTKANGLNCSNAAECLSGQCANGRCTPRDWHGRGKTRVFLYSGNFAIEHHADYCHHGHHCITGKCICPGGKVTDGFCSGFEGWVDPSDPSATGRCLGFGGDGASCGSSRECLNDHCVEDRCAPPEHQGKKGEYCHHNAHCLSDRCNCPGNRRNWNGVCSDVNKDDDFVKAAYGTGAFQCTDPLVP